MNIGSSLKWHNIFKAHISKTNGKWCEDRDEDHYIQLNGVQL